MVSIIGLGFVGNAMFQSFKSKNIDVIGYDKFKDGGIGTFEDILKNNICFLCLPTLFDEIKQEYNKEAIYSTCERLEGAGYEGLVVIKSTIEPETTDLLSTKYPTLKLCHNPEFLSARTALQDFNNQTHIVLGKGANCDDLDTLSAFYTTYFPDAEISICSSLESESMKIMCNSFYASKIMLFNEYYLLCQANGSDFNTIRDLMLKNLWINKMHTEVPGPDGLLGYGGACFPKDTSALYNYMKTLHVKSKVLKSVIEMNKVVRGNKKLGRN
jgi:UDPglucose 6-dehydrogenase